MAGRCHSCLEGDSLWPGTGNINDDPLFCGWDAPEVFVGGQTAGPGDGSEANPYADLQTALTGFSLALHADSPALGSGFEGGNMGADTGIGQQSEPARLVHLAPGTYTLDRVDLINYVSLQGAGEETIIEGSVFHARTDSVIADLSATSPNSVAILISGDEAPLIRNSTIFDSRRGIEFRPDAKPTMSDCLVREAPAKPAAPWARPARGARKS